MCKEIEQWTKEVSREERGGRGFRGKSRSCLSAQARAREQQIKENPFAAQPTSVAPPELPPALQGAQVSRSTMVVDRIIGRGQFGDVSLGRQVGMEHFCLTARHLLALGVSGETAAGRWPAGGTRSQAIAAACSQRRSSEKQWRPSGAHPSNVTPLPLILLPSCCFAGRVLT